MPLRRTGSGEIEDLLAVRTEHGAHGVCRLLLLRLLGVAVGALQKAGVRVADKVCHRLLVHAAVQKRCYEVVPQGVQVVLPRKTDGFIDLPQPLGEGVRADELPALAGELDYSVFFDRMSISGGRREADTRSCRYKL